VTERTNIRCERPFATSSPLHLPAWCCARWPLFSPPACIQPHGSLPVLEIPFFFLDWPALEPQITWPHMQKRRQSLRTAVAACCMRARALCGDHRQSTSQVAAKAPCGRPRPHIYRVVQPVFLPEGRSAPALICAGAPVRIGTRSGQVVKMGMHGGAGLDTQCQQRGAACLVVSYTRPVLGKRSANGGGGGDPVWARTAPWVYICVAHTISNKSQ
jgi:hypothetical protein